jgi:CubicO group peptidase (beta-lactamase class C family)
MNRPLLILLLIFHFTIGYGQISRGDSAYSSKKEILESYFKSAAAFGFSGAVVIAKDGNILLKNGYGWADMSKKIPITDKSIFDIGSFVKAFTATAIIQLEERGKLKTTDTITRFFKNLPADKTNITIHQLLTHTSGLNYDDFYDVVGQDIRDTLADRDLYIKRILNFPLGYQPGAGRSYSNTGFALLAAIIEMITGQKYEQYVFQNLFEPAGMLETGYYIPKDKSRVAHGYNDGPTDYGFPWTTQWEKNIPLWDLMGNGGMLSTIDDMYKWALAIQGNKILSEAAKEKMFTQYVTQGEQGLGWNVNTTDLNGKLIYRNGDAVPQAWNMDFRWYKDRGLVAILLTNKRIRSGSIRRPVMADLVSIVLQNKTPPLPDFTILNKSILKNYTGTYRLETSLLQVSIQDIPIEPNKVVPQLIIGADGQEAVDLFFPPDSSGISSTKKLHEQTIRYIEALRNRDLKTIRSIIPPDSSGEKVLAYWDAFILKNGKLSDYKILGTSPLNQAMGTQVFLSLSFSNKKGIYKVTWRSEAIWDQSDDRLQPEVTRFLRESAAPFPLSYPFMPLSTFDFVSYDLFKGKTIKFSFGIEKNGKVKTLTAHTINGESMATKTN